MLVINYVWDVVQPSAVWSHLSWEVESLSECTWISLLKILNYLSYLFLKWKRYVSSSNYSNLALMKRDNHCDQQRKKLSPLTCDNHGWISARSASYVYLRSFSFNRSFNSLCNLTKKPKIYLKTIYYDKHNE